MKRVPSSTLASIPAAVTEQLRMTRSILGELKSKAIDLLDGQAT